MYDYFLGWLKFPQEIYDIDTVDSKEPLKFPKQIFVIHYQTCMNNNICTKSRINLMCYAYKEHLKFLKFRSLLAFIVQVAPTSGTMNVEDEVMKFRKENNENNEYLQAFKTAVDVITIAAGLAEKSYLPLFVAKQGLDLIALFQK